MALVDVTKPVIINATLAPLTDNGELLRKVCFVSLGDTKIEQGKSQLVSNATYKDYLQDNNTISNVLSSFFMYANNKTCTLLELGAIAINPADDNFSNLTRYLNTTNWYKEVDFLQWIYDNKWKAAETEDILKAFWNTEHTFNQTAYDQWKTANNKQTDDNDTLKEYFKSEDALFNTSYLNYLNANQADFQAYKTLEFLKEFLATKQDYSEETYQKYLVDLGDVVADLSSTFNELKSFIDEGIDPQYMYVLPDLLGQNDNLSEFTKGYVDNNSKTYFVISLDKNTLPDMNQSWQNIKGQKSVIGLWDNSTGSLDLKGGFAGKFASYLFDLTQDNPASPFNYKILSGWSFEEVKASLSYTLIQQSLNFVGDVTGNAVLLNGRCADSRAFDYWYQWDLIAFNLENDLKATILSGVNTPSNVIKYNQDGIDILTARIKATLNSMISIGCLTEFAESLDSATNELQNTANIGVIDFGTYIANYPTNYENEIYDGFSFYLRIGRYIRQVILNVTLG